VIRRRLDICGLDKQTKIHESDFYKAGKILSHPYRRGSNKLIVSPFTNLIPNWALLKKRGTRRKIGKIWPNLASVIV
jgi:hypothetical protein